ncbi:MAG: TolC family protein [Bacteroidota bacterium]
MDRVPFSHPVCAALLALALAAMLGACSFAPEIQQTQAEAELPAQFDLGEAAQPDTLRPMPRWWSAYNDPVLNRLVDTTLTRNLDLRAAAARLVEVQNQYRIARAPERPSIGIGFDANRSNTPANTGFTSDLPGVPERLENDTYSLYGSISYERDLWGRIRSQSSAAESEFFATEEDLRSVQIAVLAETIATYFELLDLEAQRRLTEASVGLLQERIDLTEERYDRGLVTSFELYSLRQEFESTRTNVPLLEASIADARGRMSVVLGLYPDEVAALLDTERSPDLVLTPIPAGLPSDLLQARPDLAAATHRLEAARQNIGVAKASLFPSISITTTGGLQSGELSDLLDTSQYFTNLTTALFAPIFQGGALRANVEVTKAQYEQLAASYEKTLRTAFSEVGVTLVGYEKQQARYAMLLDERAAAEASLQAQEARYRRGVGDYLAYLDARRNLLRVQTSLAGAERAVADARLAVHRALGGAWIEDPDQPDA